ncbi:MAG TPA: Rieske (2Fe-2S) protein [Balneolales bacterium]|nr:Rieske (2Fe-2S) protein [Balneolales bacterium]
MDRRKFLTRLSVTLGGIAASIISIPVLGSLLAPLLSPVPQKWRKIGSVESYEAGKTVLVKFQDASPLPWAGTTAKTAAWLRKNSDTEFIAFSVNCTHLGCPVRWIPGSELFLCPCHGGVYNKDGSRASGPPPKGLNHYPVRVNKGNVEILTSPVPITNITS